MTIRLRVDEGTLVFFPGVPREQQHLNHDDDEKDPTEHVNPFGAWRRTSVQYIGVKEHLTPFSLTPTLRSIAQTHNEDDDDGKDVELSKHFKDPRPSRAQQRIGCGKDLRQVEEDEVEVGL